MDVGSLSPGRAPGPAWPRVREDQIALVLQGGGALGAYQAGVYQALHEAGLEPGWVAGVSIGAVNGAIIAGNPPERRLARLREFWEMITARHIWFWNPDGDDPRKMRNAWSAWMTSISASRGFSPRMSRGRGSATAAPGPPRATTTTRRSGRRCCALWTSNG